MPASFPQKDLNLGRGLIRKKALDLLVKQGGLCWRSTTQHDSQSQSSVHLCSAHRPWCWGVAWFEMAQRRFRSLSDRHHPQSLEAATHNSKDRRASHPHAGGACSTVDRASSRDSIQRTGGFCLHSEGRQSARRWLSAKADSIPGSAGNGHRARTTQTRIPSFSTFRGQHRAFDHSGREDGPGASLGHSRLSTTADIYTHVEKSVGEEASEALARVVVPRETRLATDKIQ